MKLEVGNKVKILSTSCKYNGDCPDHETNNHSCVGEIGRVKEKIKKEILVEFGDASWCGGFKPKDLKLLDIEWNEEENE